VSIATFDIQGTFNAVLRLTLMRWLKEQDWLNGVVN